MKLLSRLGRPHCLAIHVLVLFACFACLVPSAEANLPPVHSGTDRTVSENSSSVIDLGFQISDPDTVDNTVKSFVLISGQDAGFFEISDGELLIARNLDFENPADMQISGATGTDAGVGKNNVYIFTIRATTGAGARAMSASATWTVTITDLDEPPGMPQGLKVSDPWDKPNRLIVEWEEGNAPTTDLDAPTTPPPTTRYVVQYQDAESGWSGENVIYPTNRIEKSATITGLRAGFNYSVRVSAINDEGRGDWTTITAMTADNAAPTFTTSQTTFSVTENTPITTPVTTIAATDEDEPPTDAYKLDAVTYTLGDTADNAAFEIDEYTGVLRFKAVPDFENPADTAVEDMTDAERASPAGDNVYIVAVTAKSGEKARELSATLWLTLTVADVKEPVVERFTLVPPSSGVYTPGSEILAEVTFDDDGVDIPANLARESRPFITLYLGEATAANRRRAYWKARRDGNSTIVTFAYEVQAEDFATVITVDEELGITVPPGAPIRNGAGAAAATTQDGTPGDAQGASRLDFPALPSVQQPGGDTQPAPSPTLTQEIFVGVPTFILETPVDEKFAASEVPRTPLIFNEFGNGTGANNDWLELRNVTGSAVSLKEWELSVVQDGKKEDTSLLVFPDASVPANGLLLIVNTSPDDTLLARGDNIADSGKNGGSAHLYLVNAGLSLPDDGKFLLILRNAKEKLGKNEAFVDIAGGGGSGTDAFIRDREGKYDTYVWPLQVLQAPGGNTEDALGSGKVWQRANEKIVGYHKDAWAAASFTGLGYDRQVTKSAATAGTPGYPNGAAKETTAEGSVTLSEVMFDSAGGTLPQWIELYNNSKTDAINLNRWKLEIQNVKSEDLVGRPIVALTLQEKVIQPNQTLLIVAGPARASSGSYLPADRVYDLLALHEKNLRIKQPQDTFLSAEGFYLKLMDRDGNLVDEVGNTDGIRRTKDAPAWALPVSPEEGVRSSLVRRYDKGIALNGKERASWVLAANIQAIDGALYYGHATDLGTPGWREGGALPVELSGFSVARTDAGAVVLTWATESEVDNAGFNLRRSERRAGDFTLINAALIAGAGTTGERQTYTFTDTSAKPGVEYYYQLEEVSFAGKPQTLAMRLLRGPVSAANRQLRTFGEVKQRE